MPPDPVDRLEWENRAAHIGAYRQLYGWDHSAEPCGPEPAGDSPEKRAAWHAAHAAMTRTESLDLRGEPDGRLWHMRATYQAETAWAPPYVAEELRAIRTAIIDTTATVTRASAEALAARARGDDEVAARHEAISTSVGALGAFYRQREDIDAGLMEDHQAWSRVTEGSRRVAVLADAELRRRHPDLELESPPIRRAVRLRSRGTRSASRPGRDQLLWPRQARRQREAFREQLKRAKVSRSRPKTRTTGPKATRGHPRGRNARDAVLQPPKPEMRPALKSSAPPRRRSRPRF